MKSFEEIFESTIGKSYMDVYEQLFHLKNTQKLALNRLAKKFRTHVDSYYEEVKNQWNSEFSELYYENDGDYAAYEVQYVEYLREAAEYLEEKIYEYPYAAALWDMERIISRPQLFDCEAEFDSGN